MAKKKKQKRGIYPRDLESAYARSFGKLIESINKDYIAELRKALKEEIADDIKNLNASDIILNSTPYRKVADRLKKLREKLFNKKLFKETLKNMNNVLDRLAGRTQRGILDQLKKADQPLPSLPLKANLPALETAIEQNVNLITSITEAQADELQDTVLKSVKGGSSPNMIIEEIEKISDNGRNYAEFVARDQLAKTQAAINQDMQTRAGFPGYIWRITNDSRVRPDHAEQADKFFLWTDPPLLKNGNLHPGEDYQCRCIAEPAFGPE